MALSAQSVNPHQGLSNIRRWGLLPYFLILTASIIIAYSNTFSVPFIYDDRNIVENPSIRNLASLVQAFTPPPETGISGRPVINFTLALNYAISGMNPWSYHLLNLLIHLSSSLCLFGILRRTFQSNCLKEIFGEVITPMAFACALLWALHPLQTQAVTYTIQRCESLMGFCFLMTFYCAIRGWQSVTPRLWHLAAILSFIIGVGTKEVIAVAPVLLFIYDNIFFQRNWRDAIKQSSFLYAGLAIGLVFLGLLVSRGGTASGARQINFSMFDYWITQPEVILHYLRLVFWPAGLSIDYGWPITRLRDAWPYLVVMMALMIASSWALWKKSPLGFGAAWFFATLAPTALIPLSDIAFDHRMYLPSIVIVAIAVIGVYRILDSLTEKWIKNQVLGKMILRRGLFFLFVVSALSLGITTYARNLDYRSEVSIWMDAVQKYPDNGRAHGNLGVALMAKNDCVGAMHHFAEAIRIQPDSANAHTALGIALVDSGKIDEAIIHFRKLLIRWPNYSNAQRGLGDALLRKGLYEESIPLYKKALQIEPNNSEIYNNLGVALANQKKFPLAVHCFQSALKINPSYTEARNNLNIVANAEYMAASSGHKRSLTNKEK
jgi:tetratricopeptide (TPR) repeat protein